MYRVRGVEFRKNIIQDRKPEINYTAVKKRKQNKNEKDDCESDDT